MTYSRDTTTISELTGEALRLEIASRSAGITSIAGPPLIS